jgi:signal peptidase II
MTDSRTSALCPGSKFRHKRALFIVIGIALMADQLGKAWAFAPWRGAGRLHEILPGLYAGAQGRNYGAPLSLDGVDNAPMTRLFLTLLHIVCVGIMLRWAIRDRECWRGLNAVGGGLVLGGAIGNLVDRLALGYARDILILDLFPYLIFNAADAFVILGALLLVASWGARRLMTLATLPEAA